MIPGARKSRYDLPPVGIAWRRLNVSPKTTSHSTGCTARVNSSVRSWLSFCSSTRQNVPTRLGNRRQMLGGATSATSANTLRGPASSSDLTQASLRSVADERLARVAAEDVLQRRVRADRRLQLVRSPAGANLPEMHQRDPVAQRVGLLHVVRRHEHRHPEGVAHLLDSLPDAIAGNGVEADRRLVEHEDGGAVDERLSE